MGVNQPFRAVMVIIAVSLIVIGFGSALNGGV